MRFDREGLGFGVKMANGSHLHVTSGDAEGGILDNLEPGYGGGRGVREPNRGSVGE